MVLEMKMYGSETSELSLRETQLASLEILRYIDQFCKKYGLQYWLFAGSLIGAVRHGGFIPWDDDLDICMPRNDYERFLELFKGDAKTPPNLKLINHRQYKKCGFLITRVSDIRYQMIGEYGVDISDLGAFVDVYPLDGIGNSENSINRIRNVAKSLLSRYIRAVNPYSGNYNQPLAKKIGKRMISFVLGDPERYATELRDITKRYPFDTSKYVCDYWSFQVQGHDGIGENMWFSESIEHNFEDMKLPIPAGFNEWLISQYGDYMQLPPKEKQVSHHCYSIIWRKAQKRN